MKAVIYMRVSSDQQTEESQLEPCKALCKRRGFDVKGIYVDHAKSAYKNVSRAEYQKIMQLVFGRHIQHVIVWALDRWTRKGGVELLREINVLASYDVQLHSVQEAFLDEINIPGEIGIHLRNFLIGFLGYTAKLESEKKSQRVKDSIKFQKALKKGKVGRPTMPDGVKKEITLALMHGDSYRCINSRISYKGRYGKILHPSIATISQIANQH
ncbi:site-specific recombinase, DNA invertase Pin [Thermoplasmatales archaeon SCGC AB-539-N05]|nr:site-specific recombinase, DNA invertase Pin [Thermoplasmatales archaeon SCGC AB-539-N05]